MYVVDWWSNIEGEQFLDDQEYYFEPDEQYHLESFDQGKYNLGLSLLPIHNNQIHTHVSTLITLEIIT
jgi:hypothetical protein